MKSRLTVEQVRALAGQGMSYKGMARSLGVSASAVRVFCRRHGVQSGFTPVQLYPDDLIRERLDAGIPIKQIAAELGVRYDPLRSYVYKRGWGQGKGVILDEAELRRMVERGHTIAEMADHFHVGSVALKANLRRFGLLAQPSPQSYGSGVPGISADLEAERRRRVLAGDSFALIALSEGVSRQAIEQWAERRGLKSAGKRETVINYAKVTSVARAATFNGESATVAVAEEFECNYGTARQMISRARQMGFDIPPVADRRPPSWKRRAA